MYLRTEPLTQSVDRPPLEQFRRLTRDLYIAPGEVGFWQGVFRDPSEPAFAEAAAAINERRRIAVDVLYDDHELGQRSISLFAMTPREDNTWLTSVARHWNVDRPDPR